MYDKKYEYKYKLMYRNSNTEGKFKEYYQFTFNPEQVLKDIQEIWPNWEFKYELNPNRNI